MFDLQARNMRRTCRFSSQVDMNQQTEELQEMVLREKDLLDITQNQEDLRSRTSKVLDPAEEEPLYHDEDCTMKTV